MVDFMKMEIDPRLPYRIGGDGGYNDARALFEAMRGARIVTIGMPPIEANIEGGGLAIDFIASEGTATRRVVFGFSEGGMWVEFDSATSSSLASEQGDQSEPVVLFRLLSSGLVEVVIRHERWPGPELLERLGSHRDPFLVIRAGLDALASDASTLSHSQPIETPSK